MSKSHVRELKHVYTALFLEDLSYAYPTLRGEFEKDLSRLLGLIDCRGLHAVCVDLPALGKHLDGCLSEGEYKSSNLPCSHGKKGDGEIPVFCRGLYLLIFDEVGTLREDYDAQAIYLLRQVLYLAKKASLPCKAADILREIDEFYSTDAALPYPEEYWRSGQPSLADASVYQGFSCSTLLAERSARLYPNDGELSVLLRMLDKVSNLLTSTLGAYMPNEWKFRHGPGAISERPGSGYNKYAWSNWSDRLENVFPIADHGFYNHSSWAGNVFRMPIGSLDPPSRLIDVPKTLTKPRLIAAEPSEHQWCQQNVWNFIEDGTSKSWIGNFIRFRDQTLNQELALMSSADGSLATVDLSSASDRVTCHVVGQFFRSNPNLLAALQASRTQFVGQKLHHHVPRLIPLRKFSTMGSACTFPVESVIFLAVALAATLTMRGLQATKRSILSLTREVAVFGDDIILPVDSRQSLSKLLEVLYFKVNASKSFWNGKFRESCGVDAYDGVNVTPVYWHRPCSDDPESVASTVEVRNNFYQKFCVSTAAYLASTIPQGYRNKVFQVSMGSGVCGLKSFVKPRWPSTMRFNRDLQRLEVKGMVFSSRGTKTPHTDDSGLFQYFTECPDPYIHWTSGAAQKPKLRMKLGWIPLAETVP